MSEKHSKGRFTTSEREYKERCESCDDSTTHKVIHSMETICQGTNDKK